MPKPKILFLHLNHPAQFEFFGAWLAQNGWDVAFAHRGADPAPPAPNGIRQFRFQPRPMDRPDADFRHALDWAAENALAAAHLFTHLRDACDYHPDVVVAHVGWGVGLCIREIWPKSAYVAYHEWYYTNLDWSSGGVVERPATVAALVTNRLRNLPITAEFDSADENWCPTAFQANRFPPALRGLLTVLPDGVDCARHCPDPTATIEWLRLPPDAKLITYATRGMEPIRGFPQFLRAVEVLQKRRRDVHTVILAQEKVSYGEKLPEGDSWRKRALAALDLDLDRLHFSDMRPREDFLRVLQASDAHIYFTEPFVTSWSLLEAMASGCLVIGSNTAPVQEVLRDMETGILVDMDDPEEVADMLEWALDHPDEAAQIRAAARAHILKTYDAAHVFAQKAERLRSLIPAPKPRHSH